MNEDLSWAIKQGYIEKVVKLSEDTLTIANRSYIYDPRDQTVWHLADLVAHDDLFPEGFYPEANAKRLIRFGQFRGRIFFTVKDSKQNDTIAEILEHFDVPDHFEVAIEYLHGGGKSLTHIAGFQVGAKGKTFTMEQFRQSFKINPKRKRNAPDFIEGLARRQRGSAKYEFEIYRNGIEERLLSEFEGGVSAINWGKKIACGTFGCAFPTDIEEIIVKITSDKTEAAGAQALLSTGKWWDGLLGIHAVYSIPKYKIFALFSERVGSLHSSDYFEEPDGIPRNFDGLLFEATEIMVEPLYAMQQSILGMYPNVPDQYLDTWVEELYNLSEKLPQLQHLANDYVQLWEKYHIVFPDVHAGNLGYRIFDGAGVQPICDEWVTDLGDVLTAPSVLCLDLGIASGSGLAGSQVMKLNPPWYLDGWLDMIPRL